MTTNALQQVKGTGASGSFRLGEQKAAEGKVKKERKPKVKKAAGEQKPAAMKAAKPMSPKKVTFDSAIPEYRLFSKYNVCFFEKL